MYQLIILQQIFWLITWATVRSLTSEISKRVDQLEAARANTGMKGTLFWMAPEVVSAPKSGGYDVKVDIWSVGCIVLEMWSGKRPWAGQEVVAVMFKVSFHHNQLSF